MNPYQSVVCKLAVCVVMALGVVARALIVGAAGRTDISHLSLPRN